MRDAVSDWQALSALYEKADTLTVPELQAWLVDLRRQSHPLVDRLTQMLEARLEVRDNGFLDALPNLPTRPEPPPVAEWREDSHIGPYRLQRPLGVGGMAEVWMAQRDDGAFRRTVAIKLMFRHAGSHERDAFAQRFARERDILASLHHPNIAGLHDAGVTPSGQPWLALEYVEGEPLTAWCDKARLGVRARVELYRQVLLAVQHAHANLVIHRDLKPANVLVTTTGEVRLLDFGIAKLMEPEGGALAETELTRHAGRPLTLQYASPEQLLGAPLTTACDVYALGVVLYELLCGERPYEVKVESAAQLEQAILDVEPRAPSRRSLPERIAAARGSTTKSLRKALNSDLDAITLRALAKKPAERYGSVEALKAELDRWLDGEPVEARTPSRAYRLRKFAGRHLLGVSLGSAAIVALVAVATTAIWLGLQARQESARATAARDFMMGMFRQADSDKSHGADVTARELLDRGREDVMRRLKDQPALQADLLEGIAGIQVTMEEFTKADKSWERLADLYVRMHQDRKAANAIAARANNAVRMRNDSLALELVKSARSRVDGFHDAAVDAKLSVTEAWLALFQNDSQRVEQLFLSSLKLCEQAFGMLDTTTLDALMGLVQAHASVRNFDAALVAQTEYERRQILAPGTTARDIAALNVAHTELLYVGGRFQEVVLRDRSLRPQCIEESGVYDASCRRLIYNSAAALLRLGSPRRASGDLPTIEAIANDPTSPAFQVPALLLSFRIYSALGQLDQHPSIIESVRKLATGTPIPSLDLARRVQALQALAEHAMRDGNTAEAHRLVNEAFDLRVVTGDQRRGYAVTATTQMLQGILSLMEMHDDDALKLLLVAQAGHERTLGPTHPLALLYSLNVAHALARLDRLDEALQMLGRAEPILRNALGVDSPTYDRVARMQAVLRDQPTNGRERGHPPKADTLTLVGFFN